MLGVPTSWVYEQSRRGRIPTVTLGRCRRHRREAIDDWIREIENAGSTATARRAVG
jgi:excisionase family DNA binding protein